MLKTAIKCQQARPSSCVDGEDSKPKHVSSFPSLPPSPPLFLLSLCGWPLEQLEAKAPQAPEETAARLKESPAQDMQVEKVTQDLAG